MDTLAQKQRETLVQHGVESYKHVPLNRHYAVDLDGANALGALCQAYLQERNERGDRSSFTREGFAREVLQPLASVLPELIQERPPPEPETPKPWLDSATGQSARNPWSKPVDLTSQAVVEKRDPVLAAHLKAVAEGVSYSYLAKLQDEREARQRVRELVYTEKEHKGNVFLLSREEGALQKQSQFARSNPDYIVKFYQREANTPVRLPFQSPRNLTLIGKAYKLGPEMEKVVARASEIYREWLAADRQKLEALAEENRQELERVNKLVAVK